ncbi:unnamed protein product [Cyprideis torosa]|uniref:Amine oxidase n=1 Tax=Cyprideis torosa TaxID=163714 RepID=A0A7R8WHY4_9CRUS|nr:unnamed protein product [Cyprideis torosa]CAG0898091.1 unnamed protein product [Cyprideis torosa]
MIQENSVDVLVIGAGISGLTAAREILKCDAKLKVTVLEADGRVGGRMLTEPLPCANGKTEVFDLGAGYVSKSQTHIMDLVNEFGLQVYPQYTKGKKIMQLGKANDPKVYQTEIPPLSIPALVESELMRRKVESLIKKVPIEDPYSVENAEKKDCNSIASQTKHWMFTKDAYNTFDAAFRAVFGADSSRISYLFALAFCNSCGGGMRLFQANEFGAQEYKIKGGTQQICELLADQIGRENVLLNHFVSCIKQSKESVEVRTKDGKVFSSRYLIVTIPPHRIPFLQFDPPLPEVRRIMYENIPAGNLTKFVATYETPFWREKGFSGEVVSDGGKSPLPGCDRGPVSITYDGTTTTGSPALLGFIGSREAIQWNEKTDEERKHAVLGALANFFGDEALNPTAYREYSWDKNPYIQGGPVNIVPPGMMKDYPTIRKPFGRVFFAGADTATYWVGYMSGGVQSGQRAAAEVLHNIKGDSFPRERLLGTVYGPMKYDKKIPLDGTQPSIWDYGLVADIFGMRSLE